MEDYKSNEGTDFVTFKFIYAFADNIVLVREVNTVILLKFLIRSSSDYWKWGWVHFFLILDVDVMEKVLEVSVVDDAVSSDRKILKRI